MRKLLLPALLAAFAIPMHAQHMGFAAPHFSGRFANHQGVVPAAASFHNGGVIPREAAFPAERGISRAARFRHPAFLLPYLDSLYADYLSSTGYPVASEPPVIIMQSAPPQPSAEPSSPAQPLMIEFRDGQYMQVSGEAKSTAQVIDEPAPNTPGAEQPGKRPPPPEHNIILIFRDGHREEVSNYTVVDGFLYASSDYYIAGAWIRKVAISELNVPETVAANQSEGANFRLPHAANEVIVGP